jgi:hypothetical protein
MGPHPEAKDDNHPDNNPKAKSAETPDDFSFRHGAASIIDLYQSSQ